jgi:8-amino-7-oxononanoate synthase
MTNQEDHLRNLLEKRELSGNLRVLPDQSKLADLSSNDYLGLSGSEILRESILKAAAQIPKQLNGSTGSRLLTGNSEYGEELERYLAVLFKAESVLLFNSGYTANLALLSSVPHKGDTIIYDELSHACIKDGARLSLATHFTFRHNDPEDLRRKMDRASGNIFLVVESIYSMDGDASPVKEFLDICEEKGAALILDEAHSTGVFGENGSGMWDDPRIFARIYTFGKGLGAHGACIAGSEVLTDFLINFSRPFIYTTALPVHSLISIKEGFEFIRDHPVLQDDLHRRIKYYLAHSRDMDFNRVKSESQIQTLIIPGNEAVKLLSEELKQNGLDVRPILSPTVKEGTERLRICLHSFNTIEEIELLLQVLSSTALK